MAGSSAAVEIDALVVDNGSRAFNTEYQNNPIDEESAIFVPEKFRYYDESDIYDQYGRTIPMDLYAFWDIVQGKTGAATTMQLLRLADAGGPVSSTSLMRGPRSVRCTLRSRWR
ncbi:hypothetical protein P7H19_10515 [Paenibacillus larvae]|nr:hypothetical protein [Paenibacillus larvae]MDT2236638.1 hypothetical protein [Paenibacillus larvae]